MARVLRSILLTGSALFLAQMGVAQGGASEDVEEGSLSEDALNAEVASEIPLDKLIYNGTGCATRGSMKATLIDNDQDGFAERLRLRFSDEYVAQQGAGVPPKDFRKNCVLRLTLDQPRGWQIGVASGLFIGQAKLPKSVDAKLEAITSFPGSNSANLSSSLGGPKLGRYQRGDALDYKDIVWSRCGDASPRLGLNTQVYLTDDSGKSASVSSVKQVYWLQWRRCKK